MSKQTQVNRARVPAHISNPLIGEKLLADWRSRYQQKPNETIRQAHRLLTGFTINLQNNLKTLRVERAVDAAFVKACSAQPAELKRQVHK